MPAQPSNQVKLFALIGLIAVAAVLAYVRFGRRPSVSASPAPSELAATTATVIPPVDDLVAELRGSLAVSNRPYVPLARDLFAPAPGVLDTLYPPPEVPAQVVAGASNAPPAPAVSEPAWRLRGTMVQRGVATAILNDTFVRVGDKIGAYTVEKIGRDSVVIKSKTEELVVRLAQ